MSQIISLSSQPQDILCLIAQFSTEEDIVRFSKVSRAVHRILTNDPNIQIRIANYKGNLIITLSNRVAILRGPNGFNGKLQSTYQNCLASKSALVETTAQLENALPGYDVTAEFIDFISTKGCFKSACNLLVFNSNNWRLKDIAVKLYSSFNEATAELCDLEDRNKGLRNAIDTMTDRLNLLRGPSGSDGLIHQAFIDMQNANDAKSKEKFSALIEELKIIAHFDDQGKIIGGKIHELTKSFEVCQGEIDKLLYRHRDIENALVDAVTTLSLAIKVPTNIALSIIHIHASADYVTIFQTIYKFKDARKDFIASEKKFNSLNNELNKIAQYDPKGNLAGGVLFKLQQ